MNKINCTDCGELKKHYSRSLCQPCYFKNRRLGMLWRFQKPVKKKFDVCDVCGYNTKIYCKGMCQSCYRSFREYYNENYKIVLEWTELGKDHNIIEHKLIKKFASKIKKTTKNKKREMFYGKRIK